MGKTHRGKGVRGLYNRGRGTCPKCGRTGVKLLYLGRVNGAEVDVCKHCRNR